MKNQLKTTLSRSFWFRSFYFMFLWLKKYPNFIINYFKLKKLSRRGGDERFPLSLINFFPCLFDNTKTTSFDPHYTYHPAWAARIIAKNKPTKHIDISSILHFSTLVSAFVPVEFYDYRPAEVRLNNLKCLEGNLLKLPFKDNSVESISCMHTIEHIGLGRYGDEIDPIGDKKAVNELKRVVRSGGSLIFVTPIGRPKIEFNAHRIYSYKQVMEMFNDMNLVEFSLIPDNYKETGIVTNATEELANGQDWACGCFHFTKN